MHVGERERESLQLLCQHPLNLCVCVCLCRGGVHTTRLKNSSTTPGAALGVWDDALQTFRLMVHTKKPDCTHINLLSAFIQQMRLFPTRTGVSEKGGVVFRELVMRSENLIGNECKAHRKKGSPGI